MTHVKQKLDSITLMHKYIPCQCRDRERVTWWTGEEEKKKEGGGGGG